MAVRFALIALLALALQARVSAQQAPDIDPAARQRLEAMQRAYQTIHEFEQETTYGGQGQGAQTGVARLRLAVERPNRIVLDVYQRAPEKPDGYLTRFQCDGKSMYVYKESTRSYTQSAPPKSLKELDYLAINLEMAALVGGDPVAAMLKQAHSVRLGPPMEVDKVTTDDVAIEVGTREASAVLHLYVGQHDHLLRRFVIETDPQQSAGGVAPEPPSTAIQPSERVPGAAVYSYESRVTTGRAAKDTFTWSAPTGAYLQPNYPSIFDPTHSAVQGKATKADKTGLPPGMKPMKIISLEDLIKHARKPNQ